MSAETISRYSLLLTREQVQGKGEDALLCLNGPNALLLAALDGCGGSGGTRYEAAGNWTGARIGSHAASLALGRWFREREIGLRGFQGRAASSVASEIAAVLRAELDGLCARTGAAESSVSRNSRRFPSTLAAVAAEAAGKNLLRVLAFWAGDSRCYLFPVSGLRQLSRDDVRPEMDPFENLTRDGVLCNCLQGGAPFEIRSAEVFRREPCMVIAASDGAFAYFRSPLLFEAVLLETLMRSRTPEEWKSLLDETVGRVASDDYTLGVCVIGFRNFQAVKTAYAPRWERFCRDYGSLSDCLGRGDEAAHRALWEKYREGYLPAPGGPA